MVIKSHLFLFRFIATETVCGTLKDFVGGNYKGPPILSDNTTILKQITCALEYLHEKQIFHHDLKPSNVVISCPDGTLQGCLLLQPKSTVAIEKAMII